MDKIGFSHDLYFTSSMKILEVAKQFFQMHLPKRVVNDIDFETLRLENPMFVDVYMQKLVSDVIYSVGLKTGVLGYIYLHVEHQSTPQRLMPLRVISYAVRVMEYHAYKLKKECLPVVIPMVLYHGSKKYAYSTDIFDLFASMRTLATEYMFKPFTLLNTMHMSDDELLQKPLAGLMNVVQKHIYDEDILPCIERLLPTFKKLAASGYEQYVNITIQYIIDRAKTQGNADKVVGLIRAEITRNNEGGKVMYLIDELKQNALKRGLQEGRQRGRQEGRQEGRQAERLLIAGKLLAEGLSVTVVKQVTDLSTQEISLLLNEVSEAAVEDN